MSLKQILDFSSSLDYVFDPDLIEVSGGKAKLKLAPNPGQSFNQAFDSDVGFTYDLAKAEFTGGMVQQKDQIPTNATFGGTFSSSVNGSWGGGILTGVATGGAAVSGGKLDLTGGTQKYVDYSAVGNADAQQSGTVRWKYTPGYSGTPSTDMNMFCISSNYDNDYNSMVIRHNSGTGNIFLRTCDQNGNYINANVQVGAWSPTNGIEYEFELDYNFTTGATRIFINGVQLGATATGTGVRSATILKLRIGNFNQAGSYVSNFKIDDFVVYSIVQHTANYTPGYTLSETKYVETAVICPEMEYTGLGAIQAGTGFTTTETNAPRYTIQIAGSGNYLYWNGTAWTISNGTYAQASSAATILANIATLIMLGAIAVQVKVIFQAGNGQSNVSDLALTYTGQIYPISAPSIIATSSITTDGIDDLVAITGGTGSIKYIMKKDSTLMWWNGLAWVVSNGTSAESNTLADILTNKSSFTTTAVAFKILVLLISNGAQTSEVDNIEISYSFTAPTSVTIEKCIVYGYTDDVYGIGHNPVITVELSRAVTKYKNVILIINERKIIPVLNGYFEFELVETVNMEIGVFYTIFINGNVFYKKIPVEVSKNFLDLVDYTL